MSFLSVLSSLQRKTNQVSDQVNYNAEESHNDLNSVLSGLQLAVSSIQQSISGMGDDNNMSMYMPATSVDKISRVEQQQKLIQGEIKYLTESTNATSTSLTTFSNQFNSISSIIAGIQSDLSTTGSIVTSLATNEQQMGSYLTDRLDKIKTASSIAETGLGWFADLAGVVPIIGPTIGGIARVGARVANTINGVTNILDKLSFVGYLNIADKVTGKLAEFVTSKERIEGFASTTAELTQYANYAAGVTTDAFEKIVALNNQALSTQPTGRYYLRPMSIIPFSEQFVDKAKQNGLNLIVNPLTRFPSHGIAMLEWPINATTMRRITISTGNWDEMNIHLKYLLTGGSVGNRFQWEDSIWTSSGSGASVIWTKTSSNVYGTGAPLDYDVLTEAGETFPLSVTADMMNGWCTAYAECTAKKNYNLFNYNCHVQALAAINFARYGKNPSEWNDRCSALLLKTITGGVVLYALDGNNKYTIPSVQQVITGAASGYATPDANIATINAAAINQGGAAYLGANAALQIAPLVQLSNDPSTDRKSVV